MKGPLMLIDLSRFGTDEAAFQALEPKSVAAFFALSLILGFMRYFLWSVLLHWYFYKRQDPLLQARKLQQMPPAAGQIKREIRWSLSSCVTFAMIAVVLYVLAWKHHTRLYLNVSDHGWGYFVFSFVAMFLLHDTYFYWTHRLSHQSRLLFRRYHRIHHQSTNPTPFADIMFHPVDAALHVGFVPLFLITIPLHPLALGLFLAAVSLVNAIGHIGFEVFPDALTRLSLFRWVSRPASHNLHHSKVHCNFGLYFSAWDQLCGTSWLETEKGGGDEGFQDKASPLAIDNQGAQLVL